MTAAPATGLDKDGRERLIRLAVLHRIDQGRERFGALSDTDDQRFVEATVSSLDWDGLLDPDQSGEHLRITDQGRQVLGNLVSAFARTVPLDIFARVRVGLQLVPGMYDHDDNQVVDPETGELYASAFDPRFGQPGDPLSDEVVDLRLAMCSFLAETHPDGPQEFDPILVVFLQKLIDGELERPNFWRELRLGIGFREIQRFVANAYPWRNLCPGDEETAARMMRGIYEAGLLELQKREGDRCTNPDCRIPLAVFQQFAREEGGKMLACPCCEASYEEPPDTDLVGNCPQCGTGIRKDYRSCRGCGARVNLSLPPGTQTTSVETTTHVVERTTVSRPYERGYHGGYDYYGAGYMVPVARYSPRDYAIGLFATALVLDAIF